jgi:hypothetical protein
MYKLAEEHLSRSEQNLCYDPPATPRTSATPSTSANTINTNPKKQAKPKPNSKKSMKKEMDQQTMDSDHFDDENNSMSDPESTMNDDAHYDPAGETNTTGKHSESDVFQKETQALKRSKMVVVSLLCATAISAASLAFVFAKREEANEFDQEVSYGSLASVRPGDAKPMDISISNVIFYTNLPLCLYN